MHGEHTENHMDQKALETNCTHI